MSIGIETNEIFEVQIYWEELFTDIIEKFKIDIDIEELIEFCNHNEPKYVKLIEDTEIERYHIDDEGELTFIEDEGERKIKKKR